MNLKQQPAIVAAILAVLDGIMNVLVAFNAKLSDAQMTAINALASSVIVVVMVVLHMLGKKVDAPED